MTCSGVTPDPGQQARINCSGAGLSLVVADFGDSGTRDRFGSGEDLVDLSNGQCSVRTGRVAQSGNGFAYVSLPQDGALDRYSLLLSGDGAQDDVRAMPVC
jgi:serine/threonine-protein kinase